MRIALLDSGLGGLTVLQEIAHLLQAAELLYFADNAAFPYGALSEALLLERVCELTKKIMDKHSPDIVVLACNTASTLSLPVLRAEYAIPFVGTVPAIKPAAAVSETRRLSVLATPATVARDYTRSLIAEHAAGCQVDLIGSSELAAYAEAELHGQPVSDDAVLHAILPAFCQDKHGKTDTIVLACTHYPLLLAHFERLAPWPVTWINPAPAIARRVASLTGSFPPGNANRRIFFTAAEDWNPALRQALMQWGFAMTETEPLPFAHSSYKTPNRIYNYLHS